MITKTLKLIESIGVYLKNHILQSTSIERCKFVVLFLRDLIFLQFYKSQLFKNAFQFSFLSLSVVFLTSICTGAVLTMQTYTGLGAFVTAESIARVIVPAIIRELGPVLTGLMVAGRIASSIAAEISTMKATQQLNALKMLSIDPIKYLVHPRVFVGIALMPILLIVGDVIAVFGSYLIVIFEFNITSEIYIQALSKFFVFKDFLIGIAKSICFGAIMTIVGCSKGFYSSEDSAGVGNATTESVVLSSVLILIVNYFLTLIFF